jgi:hypothetical protein
MSKQHFFVRLIPPRSTFPMDITPDEKVLMQEHARYTRQSFDAGKILIYGPVMAPGSAFGMAVFEVADEAEVREVLEKDPSVLAGMNTFEIHPMRIVAAQGSGQN